MSMFCIAISAPSHGRAAAFGSAQHGLANNNGEASVIAVTRLAVLRKIEHFMAIFSDVSPMARR
jgi:hypothetical protein